MQISSRDKTDAHEILTKEYNSECGWEYTEVTHETSLGHPYKECVGRVQGTGFGWEAREDYFKES